MGFWDQIYDQVFAQFSDATVYFVMGAAGSLLFGIRLLMMAVGGADTDFDVDVEADGFDLDHGPDFHLLNLLSIMCFMMGAGWMGLACRLEWGLGRVPSALIASGFGFSMMALASFGLWQMKKLNQSSVYDPRTAIGNLGRVYLTIPEKGEGLGQVEINIGGRRSVVSARSSGAAIESFQSVKVLDVADDNVLVVEEVN